jgi:hypothetical protein
MMMSEPAVGVHRAMMRRDCRRRTVMMESEPAIGVAVIMMAVSRVVRRSRLFRESQRPSEQNYRCRESSKG